MSDTARSKMDPPQATAEPITYVGDTSEKTYLRKKKIPHRQWGLSKKERVRNNPANNKVWEERVGESALCAGAGICPLPIERTMVEQVFSCSLWRTPHQSRWICPEETVACVGDPTLEKVYPEGLQPVGNPRWSREKVWGGRSCREELLRTDCKPLFPSLQHCLGRLSSGIKKEGMKLNLEEIR